MGKASLGSYTASCLWSKCLTNSFVCRIHLFSDRSLVTLIFFSFHKTCASRWRKWSRSHTSLDTCTHQSVKWFTARLTDGLICVWQPASTTDQRLWSTSDCIAHLLACLHDCPLAGLVAYLLVYLLACMTVCWLAGWLTYLFRLSAVLLACSTICRLACLHDCLLACWLTCVFAGSLVC